MTSISRFSFLLCCLLWLGACQPFTSSSNPPHSSSPFLSEVVPFNQDWQFKKADEALTPEQITQAWENIALPHTPQLEPEVVNDQWQGIAWYQKSFSVPAEWLEQAVFIRFEGAMNATEVWLNNEKVGTHLGGYLPFTFDLSPYLVSGMNTLRVRLDNRDNDVTGPKPLTLLDFNTYGGLYRDVNLLVKNPLMITDEMHANEVAGGGVFVTFPLVDKVKSEVNVKTHVANTSGEEKTFTLTQTLSFDGSKVHEVSQQYTLPAGENRHFNQLITVTEPALWSPQHPNLYTLDTVLSHDDTTIEHQSRNIGIRSFVFNDKNELLINGEKTFLRGVNRHQEYPFVGYATSAQADYRDAVKIKSAGFDYVRLSHYPHSTAFMKAADELGLVLLDAILGWQYYNPTKEFEAHTLKACADLLRRDRNHASVIAWECSLNESDMPDEFIAALSDTVHAEYPGAYSAGWELGYDIFVQARQHRLQHYETPTVPYIVSEYGDWEYYAQNAGLNQDSWQDLQEDERTSRQLLNSGEKRLLQQAKNLQEAHNDNFTVPAFADGYWVMFDYNRGYADDIEASGIASIYRQPKFSYYFFQSQRNADEQAPQFESGPMVYIASNWDETSSTNVRVYSNAERVALYLNDRLIGTQSPDTDALSTHLAHPPFTFSIDNFQPGTLRAEALISENIVARHSVTTPEQASALTLRLDTSGIAPTPSVKDKVFVYAQVVDAKGNPVRTNNIELNAEVEGDIRLLNQSPITTSWGEGALLIEIGETLKNAEITVTAKGLKPATLSLEK